MPFTDPASAPAERSPGVSLRGASLSYSDEPVFRNLGLELVGSEITCLLGPSGVGKSSLLRLIAGIAPEATAERLTDSLGRPVTGRIAYMDQRDLLLPWLSVLDNVLLGSRLRGEPRDTAKARRLLTAVGLSDSHTKRPAALSGGMRQRAALARTLMEEKPIVLMDEPFSAVDALTRYRLQTLAAATLANRTVLLVTHDPSEAIRLGHRVLVMRGIPATFEEALVPASPPPRDPASKEVQTLVGKLLRRLAVERNGL